MRATIEIDGHQATIAGGQWSCADQAILAKLQALESPTHLPDAANAYAAVDALGGRIISAEPEEPETDEDGRQLIY